MRGMLCTPHIFNLPFSQVCEKVESKGRTTYNEVADELVKDFSNPDMMGEPP